MDNTLSESRNKVTIIGAAGRMGLWFTNYFISNGYQTTVFDIKTEEAKKNAQKTGAFYASNNRTAVNQADYVFLCTPIKTTSSIIIALLPHMKKGSILAEIASIKSRTYEALKEVSKYGVKPLSIHPMFGPTTDSIEGTTVIVVPVKNQSFEERATKMLFPGSIILVEGPNEHDKIMAINLSLIYFINLALGSTLSSENIVKLKGLAGTSFTLQLALVESIVNEDPELIEDLLFENKLNIYYMDKFISELGKLKDFVIEKKKTHTLLKRLRHHYEMDPDFSSADKRRYEAYKVLRKK